MVVKKAQVANDSTTKSAKQPITSSAARQVAATTARARAPPRGAAKGATSAENEVLAPWEQLVLETSRQTVIKCDELVEAGEKFCYLFEQWFFDMFKMRYPERATIFIWCFWAGPSSWRIPCPVSAAGSTPGLAVMGAPSQEAANVLQNADALHEIKAAVSGEELIQQKSVGIGDLAVNFNGLNVSFIECRHFLLMQAAAEAPVQPVAFGGAQPAAAAPVGE